MVAPAFYDELSYGTPMPNKPNTCTASWPNLMDVVHDGGLRIVGTITTV